MKKLTLMLLSLFTPIFITIGLSYVWAWILPDYPVRQITEIMGNGTICSSIGGIQCVTWHWGAGVLNILTFVISLVIPFNIIEYLVTGSNVLFSKPKTVQNTDEPPPSGDWV